METIPRHSDMLIKGGKKDPQDHVGYGSWETVCTSGKIMCLADT